MFAFESILAGADLTIAVRDSSLPAANLIKSEIKDKLDKDAKVVKLGDVEGEFDLLINGTPVGMFPKVDASVLPKEKVQKCKAVFDAVYNPQETLILKYAKEAGIKYSNGTFQCLFGKPQLPRKFGLTPNLLWTTLKSFKNNARGNGKNMNIILCGFMGSGKTTIVHELARMTGRKFVDTDNMVENEQGTQIKNIFSEYGEDFFRELEYQACKR